MHLENTIIKNEFLNVTISSHGAQITSVKDEKSEERIHQPDMIFWTGQAPVLFPFCGNVKDKKIVHNGKEYPMTKHGFARDMEFDLLEWAEDFAVFSLVANEETKKIYPFDFEFIVTYKLLGNSIDVSYEVINDSKENMYFAVGSHEAYICIDGLGEYEIHFEKEEDKKPYIFETGKLLEKFFTVKDNHSVISLCDELFEGGTTVIFDSLSSDFVYLKNKNGDNKIRVEFEDAKHLLLWTKPHSQFICIEPWTILPDTEKSPLEISKKQGIISLSPDGHYENHHIISFF